MKKTKLLSSIACISSVVGVAAPLTLTSCNPKKDDSGIDVKKNDNIKISCESITVGEPWVMTYEFDPAYGFDLIKSTITFSDSNATIALWQCTINKEKKTITVPAEYVTSKNVTVDIKAESNSAISIEQADYEKAIDLLATPAATRHFDCEGFATETEYDKDGKAVRTGTGELTFKAEGTKSQLYLSSPTENEAGLMNCITTADSVCGYWNFSIEQGGTMYKRYCTAVGFTDWWIREIFEGFSKDFSTFNHDEVYNAYWKTWKQGDDEDWTGIVKFNAEKKLCYIGYNIYHRNAVGDHDMNMYTHMPIEYKNVDVAIPSKYEDVEGTIHTDPDKYIPVSTHVELETSQISGRYLIPVSKIPSYSTSDPIIIKFDQDHSKEEILIHNGTNLLVENQDYTVSDTMVITINAGKFAADQSILLVIGGGASSVSSVNRMIITQNDNLKFINLFPNTYPGDIDGFFPSECSETKLMDLVPNIEYTLVLNNFRTITANTLILATKFGGTWATIETYTITKAANLIRVVYNGVDETDKATDYSSLFDGISLNNEEGYTTGKLEITFKVTENVSCVPCIVED